jgi:hypothetical protein
VHERIGYREAQNRGHAITETKSAKLNADADALMEALLGHITRALKGAATTAKRRKGT